VLTIEGSVGVTWALATIALVLRFVCRRISHIGFWWDDYLMIPAYIATSIVSWIGWVYMIPNGFGRHIYIQRPENILNVVEAFLKSLFIVEVCYTAAVAFAKYSILAFYWRIFKPNRSVRLAIYFLTGIMTCWALAVVGHSRVR
jgi:hypothetical protein